MMHHAQLHQLPQKQAEIQQSLEALGFLQTMGILKIPIAI